MSANQLINILIRSHQRQQEFKKCIASIRNQNYKKIHLIVSTHDEHTKFDSWWTLKSSGISFEMIQVYDDGVPYHWNLYCNGLKSYVKEGWFFYLDSDDWISKRISLAAIAPYLNGPEAGVICQYFRGRTAKPTFAQDQLYQKENLSHGDWYVKPEAIVKGRIGGSAIFLHHTHKDLAHWDGNRASDYRFIKAVAEKIPLKFVPIPVVQAGNSGRHGL